MLEVAVEVKPLEITRGVVVEILESRFEVVRNDVDIPIVRKGIGGLSEIAVDAESGQVGQFVCSAGIEWAYVINLKGDVILGTAAHQAPIPVAREDLHSQML